MITNLHTTVVTAMLAASMSLLAPVGAYAGDTWIYPQPRPLRVHIVRGLWHRYYGIETALARCGGALLSESWHTSKAPWYRSTWLERRNGELSRFPGSPAKLAGHHVVVICNINGLSLKRHHREELLEAYVKNGGSILFLGGRYAMGLEYHGKAFEKCAPVQFKDGVDLKHMPEGLALRPGPDTIGAGFSDLPWDGRPRNFWHHEYLPKKGAKLLLKAGENPLLIVREYGKGRVAVFAGSVMGDPPPGALPFWEWEGWPVVLARTIQWLAEAPSRARHDFSPQSMGKLAALTADLEAKSGKDASPLLKELGQVCRSRKSARALVAAVARVQGDTSQDTAAVLAETLPPLADGECADDASAMVRLNTPFKALVGLRLLGKSRSANALEVLQHAAEEGKLKQIVDQLDDEPDADDDPTGALDVSTLANPALTGPGLESRIRLAALAGLGDYGDRAALPALRKAMKAHSTGAFSRRGKPNTLNEAHRLYQEAILSRLRCGDAAVADEVVDIMLENLYAMARARMYVDIVNNQPTAAHKALPQVMRWQQRLYERLQTVPETVLPALAKRIAAEHDWRVTAIAFAAFAGKELPGDVRAILKDSRVPAVAALGK